MSRSLILAWLVHLYTALGAIVGFFSILAIEQGSFREAFFLMAFTVVIDATDGTLARAARVKEVIPWFDGNLLDEIVDYLNFVLAPCFFLVHAGLLPPQDSLWLAALPLQKGVVLHANHANEFDAGVDAACARLREAGATLLNQSVLLRGVNDDADALAALCERSFAAGVLPYYLHQLDKVQGAAHFEVDDERALALVDALRARLPGYLVPKLVRELQGDASKRPIADFAR